MLKLLVVDNYDSFTYNLVQLIEQSGLCFYEVKKSDAIDINSAAGFDKIIFSPGAGIPAENPVMFEIIKNFSATKSILGICLGFQAIAEAFGAQLTNMNNVTHGIKKNITVVDSTEYLFKDVLPIFSAGLYHSWRVSEKNFPDELTITAVSNDEVIMALAHKTYDVRGVQFHPESIMTDFGKKIINNWLLHVSKV
ncbi:MAG: aminodeoxychorismate/anthranilate synthase component II [Ignavibacteriales bacterium]|nr:aminodeoxychorismate/anthranilate synthase component II [Ignavibacteriales bacterium]